MMVMVIIIVIAMISYAKRGSVALRVRIATMMVVMIVLMICFDHIWLIIVNQDNYRAK